jgi:hypothetical protein
LSEYAGAAGFVQFDPREKDVNGQEIRELTIKAFGTQKLIQITLWPEYAGVEVKKGDFVAVDGKFTSSLGQKRTTGETVEYIQITPYSLVVLPAVEKAERKVVQKAAPAAAADSDPLF